MFGLAAGKVSGLKTENEMRSLIAKNVNVTDIVYKQWADQLKRANFNLKRPEDAILEIEVSRYGFMVPNVFTNKYYPILYLEARLLRNKKIIWQDGEIMDGFIATKDIPRYDFDEIKKDPKKLQAMLDKAAEKVILTMIQGMKSNK